MTRRTLLLVLALAGALGPAYPARAGAAPRAVSTIGMTVGDMERSVAFYRDILSFEPVSDVEVWGGEHERLQGVFGLRRRVVRLRLGSEELELSEYLTPRGRPVPADSRSHDRWFQHAAIVVSDMDRAYAWLRRHGVEHVSPAPQRLPDWNPAAGGIRAFYFRDPDRHVLEIIWFPPGKGDPRWQAPTGRLFLGIDHTAIAVADTAASLGFYRDLLGLRVAGESDNHGPEQERLNHVFGARLRITTLRAPAGPGIELLEYLTPRDGRPMPADVGANDVVHWQVRVEVDDVERVAHRAAARRAWLVSPGVVTLPGGELGFRRGTLLRDPDGHAVQLSE